MKSSDRLIATLDELLREELTAVNQYFVHAEMCASWGYAKLHERIEKRSIQEMKHAEKLISRILFLEGRPTVSRLNEIHIGDDVPKQFRADLDAELSAVRMYNDAIRVAGELGDSTTRQLLESILNDEDAHVDWLEEQLDQIQQMGLQIYLSTKTSD